MARVPKPETEKAMKLSISVQPAEFDRLIKYCQREERPISWVYRKALAEWLDKHDKQ